VSENRGPVADNEKLASSASILEPAGRHHFKIATAELQIAISKPALLSEAMAFDHHDRDFDFSGAS